MTRGPLSRLRERLARPFGRGAERQGASPQDAERQDGERQDAERQDAERQDGEPQDTEPQDAEPEGVGDRATGLPVGVSPEPADAPAAGLEGSPGSAGSGLQDSVAEERGAPGKRAPRRWRRWVVGGLLTLALLVVAARVALAFALPDLARRAGAALGLEVELEDHSLSCLSGQLSLTGLRVRLAEPDEGLLFLERLEADLDLGALALGRLSFESVRLSGLRGRFVRDGDGVPRVARVIADALGIDLDEEDDDEDDDEGPPVDLRFSDVHVAGQVEVLDLSVAPVVSALVSLEVRADEWILLAPPFWPREATLDLSAPGHLERLELRAQSEESETVVDLELRGASPKGALRSYLRLLHLEPRAARYGLSLRARADTAEGFPGRLAVDHLRVSGGESEPVLELAEASCFLSVLDEPRHFRALDVGRLSGAARRTAGGRIELSSVALLTSRIATNQEGPRDEEREPPVPWVLGRYQVRELEIALRDEGIEPPLRSELRGALDLDLAAARDEARPSGAPQSALRGALGAALAAARGEASAGGPAPLAKAAPQAAEEAQATEAAPQASEEAPQAAEPTSRRAEAEPQGAEEEPEAEPQGAEEEPEAEPQGAEEEQQRADEAEPQGAEEAPQGAGDDLESPGSLRLEAALELEGIAQVACVASGSLSSGAGARLRVEGVDLEPLAGYLRLLGLRPLLSGEGRLRADARWDRAEGGGGGRLSLRALDLRAGERELLHVASCELPLKSLSESRAELGQVEVLGLRGRVTRGTAGLALLGVELAGTAPPSSSTTCSAPRAGPFRPASQAEDAPLALDLSVEGVRVEVERLELPFAEGEALELRQVRLESRQPLFLDGDLPAASSELELSLSAELPELCQRAELELTLDPFSPTPRALAQLRCRGLDPSAWARRLELEELSGDPLELELGLVASAERRSQGDEARWRAQVQVHDLKLTRAGERLGGLERVELEGLESDSSGLVVDRATLRRPQLTLRRVEEGWRCWGLQWRVAAEEAPQESSPELILSSAQPPAREEEGSVARIRRLQVRGASLDVIDQRQEPALSVPLRDLHLELRGLASDILERTRAVRLDARWRGGEVDLPAVGERLSSIPVFGAGLDALRDLGGQRRAPAQQRTQPLVEEGHLRARFTLTEPLDGVAELVLREARLSAFHDQLAAEGVELRNGRLDLEATLRVRAGRPRLETLCVFQDLRVGEEATGFLTDALGLPTSIEFAASVLQNEHGEVRVPFSIDLSERGGDTVTEAVVAALGQSIAESLARSPRRLLGEIGLLGSWVFDLFRGDPPPPPPRGLDLEFEPGVVALPERAALRVARVLSEDEEGKGVELHLHHLAGELDLERARERTRPSAVQLAQLRAGLKDCADQLRRQLAAQRERLKDLSRATAPGSAGRREDLMRRMRRTFAELGRVLRALASARRLAGERGERSRELYAARARAALEELGQRRLEAVRRVVLDHGGRNLSGRTQQLDALGEHEERPRGRVHIDRREAR